MRFVAAICVVALAMNAGLAAAVDLPQMWWVCKGADGNWTASSFPFAYNPKCNASEAVATLSYRDTMTKIGWDRVNVTTNGTYSDEDQAYAAGFVEGIATFESIQKAYNSYGYADMLSEQVIEFLNTNWAWMGSQVAALGATDPYWHQVGLEMQQFQGMLDAVNYNIRLLNVSGGQWTLINLSSMVAQGDLIDLGAAYPTPQVRATRKNWRDMTPDEFEAYVHKKTHCSALIKLDQDLSDIFFGHATWAGYNTMLRSFKHYHFNYRNVTSSEVSFSSYPGALTSTDDYYVTDSGLVIIETTNNIYNESLYNLLKPQTLLYWVRVKVATRLATSAGSWMQLFGRYNSGTYNNQWMALDLNLFTPFQDLVPGTLWIGEQIPGLFETQDVTKILSYGYWPSYNVPFFKNVFDLSGYPEAIQQQGPEMNDYQTCARAEIFRRDQANVQDMPSMMTIMQYNQYKTDPLSNGRATHAIAARGDLLPSAMCFGAIDAKVSSWKMFTHGRQILAYSGPTPQQGTFSWKGQPFANQSFCAHYGQPDRFDFLWQHFQPDGPNSF